MYSFIRTHFLSSVTGTYFRDLFGVLTHLCDQLDQQKEVAATLSSLYDERTRKGGPSVINFFSQIYWTSSADTRHSQFCYCSGQCLLPSPYVCCWSIRNEFWYLIMRATNDKRDREMYWRNEDIMPELKWKQGYLYVWMVFLGIVLFEVIVFWFIGWINFAYLYVSLSLLLPFFLG